MTSFISVLKLLTPYNVNIPWKPALYHLEITLKWFSTEKSSYYIRNDAYWKKTNTGVMKISYFEHESK